MREIANIMENLFKAENPIWLTIVIAIFILALALILSPSTGAKLVELIVSKRRKQEKQQLTQKFFLNHPIYDFLAFNKERLKTLDFGSPGKTAAICDMLHIFFTTYHEYVKEFITEGIHCTDKFDFKKLVKEKLLFADQACEIEWQKLEIEGLSQLIKDFNKWQQQSIAFTHMAVCNVTDSNIYDNELERMEEILKIIETRFRVTMPDIEKGLDQANGRYKALSYKSVYTRRA